MLSNLDEMTPEKTSAEVTAHSHDTPDETSSNPVSDADTATSSNQYHIHDHNNNGSRTWTPPPVPSAHAGEEAEMQLTSHVSRTSRISNNIYSSLKRTQTSGTNATNSDPMFEVDFEEGEKTNPKNWPLPIVGLIIVIMSFGTTSV